MTVPNQTKNGSLDVTQLLHENETWKRLLEYIQTENVYLKNRLAQITRADNNNAYLEEIEQYQNVLVTEDGTISMLRNDVAKQEKRIKRELGTDKPQHAEVRLFQSRLRRDIEIAEQKFNSLKFSFNSYFSDKLSG